MIQTATEIRRADFMRSAMRPFLLRLERQVARSIGLAGESYRWPARRFSRAVHRARRKMGLPT